MGRPRKYNLNENYFEKVNTQNKSYVLGFIYADGSVYENYLSIRLSKKDIEILNFIKKELEYGGKIRTYQVNDKYYVDLTICSNKIIGDLFKLGIIRNKTYLSKKLPLYEKKYEWDLLRGFFDGDGSIYSTTKRGRTEYTICFSNNISVLNQVKNILINYNISSCKIRHRYNNNESCMLEIRGNKNIEKINKLLYKNSDFYLKRKKKRFDNFILMVNNLTKRNISDDIINEIKLLYLSGVKQVKIGKSMKIPQSSVKGIIQRLRKHGKIK